MEHLVLLTDNYGIEVTEARSSNQHVQSAHIYVTATGFSEISGTAKINLVRILFENIEFTRYGTSVLIYH